MTEDTSLREKALRPTWLETMAPNIKRFEVAAAFGGRASWNSVGSAAMAELIKTMAKLIDQEVGRRDAKDRRIEALEAENEQRRKEQPYIYIGKGGKSVLARDLEDDRDRLKAEHDELRAVAIKAQAVLAMFVAPDAIKQTTVINAYAAAVEAEAELRAALSGKEGQS